MKSWHIFALVLVGLAALALYVGLPIAGTPTGRSVDRADACFMAQEFVKDALKAPATADFPAWHEPACKVRQRERIWIVSSYVDSENGFGANIRSDYTVEMIYYPASDKWTLVDIGIAAR